MMTFIRKHVYFKVKFKNALTQTPVKNLMSLYRIVFRSKLFDAK